jgi:8-oxo-dGTP pyrophosphatase MutT (NUDIX family)
MRRTVAAVSTTAVVAEILIVGLEAEAWLALLIVTIFGTGWIDLTTASKFAPILLVLMLATAYVLGIMVDRVADSAFKLFNGTGVGRWNNRRFGKTSEDWTLPAREETMRMAVMREGGGIAGFVDYQRSRIRVARGTALNLIVGVIVGGVYFAWRKGWGDTVRFEALLLGLLLVTVPVAERIRAAWLGRLQDAYRALVPEDPKQQNDGVVAAVPYERTAVGPRFLIVRTKGRTRWTFPKGHVEVGESGRAAALRELQEEAGVRGEAEPEPFTTYRYPPTRAAASHDSLVQAFLVEVPKGTHPAPGEHWRKPRWFAPEEAKAKLAEDREPQSASEHRRVIDEALARIG